MMDAVEPQDVNFTYADATDNDTNSVLGVTPDDDVAYSV